ncbi:MAG TPA: ATP-binding protein [Acidimicrobiales bacterium]|nr:ATP-binding protein [Acidimicrobiales bacterium]
MRRVSVSEPCSRFVTVGAGYAPPTDRKGHIWRVARRRRLAEPRLEVERAFEPDGSSARAVRRFVADALTACRVDPAEVVLLASELVTNVVIHARTEFTVTVSVEPDVVHLSVHDGNSRLPVRPATPVDATSGRGLALVDAVARTWGVEVDEDGKTVWCEVPVQAGGGRRRDAAAC